MLVDHVAVGVLDPLDEVGLDPFSLVGDTRVGGGHFERAHRLGAEDDGRDGAEGRLDPEPVGDLHDVGGADPDRDLAEHGVDRAVGRRLQGDDAGLVVAGISADPGLDASVFDLLWGRVVPVRVERYALLQGSDESERLEGRSGIAAALGGDVVLALAGLQIGSEVESRRDHDLGSGAVVDHGDRPRRAVRARREPLLEDAARLLLEA